MSPIKDPYKNFKFVLKWDGKIQAGFSDITIPDISADPIEYRKINEIDTVRKIPGLIKYSNIVLKRGVTDNLELFKWYKETIESKSNSSRKDISILLLDEVGNESLRWDFANVWLTKYKASDLYNTNSEIAIETLHLSYEDMIEFNIIDKQSFQIEYYFSLPKGYVEKKGKPHKNGIMRLATAADEIHSMQDQHVIANPNYLIIILLSKVITKLGDLENNQINTKVIESLFVADIVYLRKFYQKINSRDLLDIKTSCPKCNNINLPIA